MVTPAKFKANLEKDIFAADVAEKKEELELIIEASAKVSCDNTIM